MDWAHSRRILNAKNVHLRNNEGEADRWKTKIDDAGLDAGGRLRKLGQLKEEVEQRKKWRRRTAMAEIVRAVDDGVLSAA